MSKSKAIKLNVGLILTLILSGFLFLVAPKASAQTADDEKFVYKAQSGDNLYLLARRSIDLYASEQEVELTTGQLMAAETWLVNRLGAFELDVDQEVTIAVDDIKTAVDSVADMSKSRQASWEVHGPITRNLTSIKPSTAPEYVSDEDLLKAPVNKTSNDLAEEVEDAKEDQTKEESSDQEANQDSENKDQAAEETEEDDQSAPWYWWAIGGALLGAMWYVLAGGNKRK